MRFVPSNCIKEGYILGSAIYGRDGQLWLSKGTLLDKNYVEKLNLLKINGIYIQDDDTVDIDVKEIIGARIRATAVKAIKDVFIHAVAAESAEEDKKLVNELIAEIVNDIINNNGLMVNMIDLKYFDDYTFHHSVNVAVLSVVMGVSLGFTREELYGLGISALLHDIGKVFVDKEIIDKPGKLTDYEFDEIKKHTFLGYGYLKDHFKLDEELCQGALQHHEKYDGSGYPRGLVGEEIALSGRIIALADVYDAFVSDRPYRKAVLPSEAIEFIYANGGILFDFALVEIFLKKIAPYPSGTLVQLSDGRKGFVSSNNERCGTRPVVKIVHDGEKPVKAYDLDMTNDLSTYAVTIKQVLHDL